MNTITKLALATLLGTALFSTTATADVKKGQKLYMKKMKAKCGYSGAKFAGNHTQAEWEAKKDTAAFKAEAAKLCPGLELKDKYVEHIYDFSHEYASDSGNVPSC